MYNNLLKYFDDTVEKEADKYCIVDQNESITFRELRDAARVMATNILDKTGRTKNKPIAVFLPKGIHVYVADIACAYSGNIFMNLDVKTPAARIGKIIETIKPSMIITAGEWIGILVNALGDMSNIDIVTIDDLGTVIGDENEDVVNNRISEMIDTDPLCIINTSGSTGTPKGVVLNHRSFLDFVDWSVEKFGFDGTERIGALSPVFFDIYEYEMCLMMRKGATIVLLDASLAVFPVKLLNYMVKHSVSYIFWVPSIMVNIANMDLLSKIVLRDLRIVWFAGEVFPTKQFNYWRKHLPNVLFANLYGPIEITLDCTCYIVDREFKDSEPLPIGYACENTDVFILDDNRLCVTGEVGELCVRGTSLAMGYYNNPEKTASVFVQNPLNEHYPELIYRTGDLACVNELGEIIFKGRKDNLIKHMGYRVELGEIEHVIIDTLKLVDYACVVYQYQAKEITLFYEPKKGISEKEIRQELLKVLPRYMIPMKYYEMDELPRNANGKIDRLGLSRSIN